MYDRKQTLPDVVMVELCVLVCCLCFKIHWTFAYTKRLTLEFESDTRTFI